MSKRIPKEHLPQIIYLIPDNWDGQDCWLWTDDPSPTSDHKKSDAQLYMKATKEGNLPMCEFCQEKDCVVDFDGHCELIRVYLKAKNNGE